MFEAGEHGYPGFKVMPPFPIYKAGKMDAARFEQLCKAYVGRLANLFDDEPLRFRRHSGGDYEVPVLTLRPHVAPGRNDLGIHMCDD